MTRRVGLAAAALLLAGCGFQPLYATRPGEAPGLRGFDLASLEAPTAMRPIIARAFARRAGDGESAADYDLVLKAREQAERLAVQSDASVTRYNYRLVGEYTAVERATGRNFTGRAESITSFNVVNSQYSTLFAEQAAKDKAAVELIENIERDLMLQIAAADDKQ